MVLSRCDARNSFPEIALDVRKHAVGHRIYVSIRTKGMRPYMVGDFSRNVSIR